ncbi:MAG: DNA translocase FtsK [Alistipes sp.]|nr:DNA translocase FtsK [Alistipes sp.]
MATTHKSASNGRQKVKKNERTTSDSLRWIGGLLLIFIGLFAAASVLFSFFSWEADQSGLCFTTEERVLRDLTPENLCGWTGARVGMLLVDKMFGVFGLLLPIIVLVLGVRIIRKRPLLFNHLSLSLVLVMLLGSLTLGALLGEKWSLCSSTGWGGAYGVAVAQLLDTHIGPMGLAILLLGGWILTGVFINRNFIDTINGVGNNLVDKAGQVVERLRHHETPTDVEELTIDDEEEDIPAPIEPIEPQPQPVVPVEPEPQPAPVVEEEEDPFTVIDLPHHNDEEQITEPVEPEPVAPVEEQDPDDPFTVIDLKKDRPQPEPQPAPQPAPQPEPQPVPAPVEEEEGIVVIVEEGKEEEQIKKTTELYDPTKDLLTYKKPPFTLLEDYQSESEVSEDEIFENKSQIEETLKTFGIPIQRIKATVGPTVTLYEIVQAQGVKISKIQGLEQDIAQSLKASGIRIIAPIPGKGTIGIEVPNRHKRIVSMYSAIRSKRFHETKAELPVVIGRTIQNENYVFDLAKLPHLLVAGSTGTGKSVGLNAIITSLLYRKHPSELKLVMIDPKMVEFSLYGRLERHFLAKMESEDKVIITDPMKAVYTLQSLCVEMENRLELLSKADTRNIVQYNTKFTARRLNPEKGHRFLPYIVVVIDEFADLIMMAKEVERPVMRLAQKARAVGIHLIVATQRPDVKVITGGIKANFPARIAFRVIQMIDSRTILDRPGAEQLIGRGDMLFSLNGDVTRVQCALVDTDEVERIVDHISHQQGYTSAYLLPDYAPEGSESQMGSEEQDVAPKKYDSLFAEIARDAVESGSISTSMIQRNYEVGFNRAGRIMMQLERAGIVGRAQGAKPRDVLFHDLPSLEAKLQDLGLF